MHSTKQDTYKKKTKEKML